MNHYFVSFDGDNGNGGTTLDNAFRDSAAIATFGQTLLRRHRVASSVGPTRLTRIPFSDVDVDPGESTPEPDDEPQRRLRIALPSHGLSWVYHF